MIAPIVVGCALSPEDGDPVADCPEPADVRVCV
jgi:hypothetical protein